MFQPQKEPPQEADSTTTFPTHHPASSWSSSWNRMFGGGAHSSTHNNHHHTLTQTHSPHTTTTTNHNHPSMNASSSFGMDVPHQDYYNHNNNPNELTRFPEMTQPENEEGAVLPNSVEEPVVLVPNDTATGHNHKDEESVVRVGGPLLRQRPPSASSSLDHDFTNSSTPIYNNNNNSSHSNHPDKLLWEQFVWKPTPLRTDLSPTTVTTTTLPTTTEILDNDNHTLLSSSSYLLSTTHCHSCQQPFHHQTTTQNNNHNKHRNNQRRRRHWCPHCRFLYCSQCYAQPHACGRDAAGPNVHPTTQPDTNIITTTTDHNRETKLTTTEVPPPITTTANQPSSHPTLPPEDDSTSAIARIRASTTTSTSTSTTPTTGSWAAQHLEQMTLQLLQTHATLTPPSQQTLWKRTVLPLVTHAVFHVHQKNHNNFLLDIRNYIQIKCLPGGSRNDCQYISGVVFTNRTIHKQMTREIVGTSTPNNNNTTTNTTANNKNNKPSLRILLIHHSIDVPSNQLTSFETHPNNIHATTHHHHSNTTTHHNNTNYYPSSYITQSEQEKYIQQLVTHILQLQPDVVFVAQSVCRQAQELLLKHNPKIVVVQHVKESVLERLERQTCAVPVLQQPVLLFHQQQQQGPWLLGTQCQRFRMMVLLKEHSPTTNQESSSTTTTTTLHERQSILAAQKLGSHVLDGGEAVRTGLAKRGVVQTILMVEGCPKHLGSTIVLRGAEKAALKQIKTVLKFLLNVAYNLRLETQYFKDRRIKIRPGFVERECHLYSSSLCIDYGKTDDGRIVRPWNGGAGSSSSARSHLSDATISAFDFQSILITSIWMCGRSQCCPAEVKGICYYSMQDVALGSFLRDSCFNLSLKCQNPNCKKSVLEHSLSFAHKDGLINISVEELQESLPSSADPSNERNGDDEMEDEIDEDGNRPIATWTYCRNCDRVVTPLVFISEDTWKFSFGKFLEIAFYNRDAILDAPTLMCSCEAQSNAVIYFGCGRLAARFNYERILPYNVFVRHSLPSDPSFRKREAVSELNVISQASSDLFARFDKHISRISREARALFKTATNRPEHLQTLIAELNSITSEIDVSAKTLQEKTASVSEQYRRETIVTNQQYLQFPWYARRYLFLLASAWNEKLSAIGKTILVMKKISSINIQRDKTSNQTGGGGDPHMEELGRCMERLRKLKEYYSRYDPQDIDHVFPTLTAPEGTLEADIDEDFEESEMAADFPQGVDADVLASRQRLRSNPAPLNNSKSTDSKRISSRETSRAHQNPSDQKGTPGGAVKSAFSRFFNRGGRDRDPYVVDLGLISDGRPRLVPGSNGIIPVYDEQWGSIIAYSLSSSEYEKLFENYTKSGTDNGDPGGPKLTDQETTEIKGGTVEKHMLKRTRSHIKHTFRDSDEKGHTTCKFVCTSYWSTQFHAVRQAFLISPRKPDATNNTETVATPADAEKGYIESLMSAYSWAASGGKSGASFALTSDGRFVLKAISRTELQMFLDCAPAYFEYLSKAFFHGLPTVLCKIVGVYQIGVHNRETGKRVAQQIAVMPNIFYNRRITKIFDLKGSLRGRFASQHHHPQQSEDVPRGEDLESQHGSERGSRQQQDPSPNETTGSVAATASGSHRRPISDEYSSGPVTLLDGDFLEYTLGRPMPLTDRAKSLFQMSILNDTLFLSIINVLDYSILVGIDEDNGELVVGIIDFMRQYDILKQMERVGKSLPMVVGSEAPTIIQPPLYKQRFTNAMERYFMTVPSKYTTV